MGLHVMKISSIKLKLTAKELLDMINENIKIQGLKIENVKINKYIKISVSYKIGIKINLNLSLDIINVEDNVLSFKIFKIKIGKIPIFSKIINLILHNVLKKFMNMGITCEKEILYINFNLLSKYIPKVEFNIKDIILRENLVHLEIENLVYCEEKEVLSIEDLKEKIENENKSESFNKTKDEYSKVRYKIKNTIPDKYKNIGEYAMIIPDIIALMYRLLKDKRIDLKTKALISSMIGYLVLPMDFVPDFIPVIGGIDDVAIMFWIFNKIIESIPRSIMLEHWQGDDSIMEKANDIKELCFKTMGRKTTINIFSGVLVFSKRIIFNKKKRKK